MKKILFITALACTAHLASAQSVDPDVVSTSGGYQTGSNAALSWTLGEPVSITVSSSSAMITQGFQQPQYDFTSISEDPSSGFTTTVFPNPASEMVQLGITAASSPEDLSIELYDAVGKLLMNGKIAAGTNLYSIDMQQYAPGSYLLKVSTASTPVSTHKIQKLY